MSDYLKQRLNQKIHGKVTEPKKRKWLKRSPVKKKVADKRAVENEIYRELRISYLAKHKFCQCGCGRKATEIHHMRGRVGKYKGESLLIVVNFFMAVSNYCHRKITNNPEWAIEMGYSLKRNIKSEKQPIMTKKSIVSILLIGVAFLAMSFCRTEQKEKWIDASQAHRSEMTFDTSKKKQTDTIYYISEKINWFQLLFKAVNENTKDSISEIERSALLGWIINLRPILPADTSKTKAKPK